MSTYSSYGTSSPPVLPMFLMLCAAVLLVLSIIPTLVDPGDVGYICSTGGGLLRVYLGWEGQVYIGHDGAPGLLAAAEKIAAAVGAIVAP